MKQLKATDLRKKSVADLETLVADERAALYMIRRDLVFRKTTDTASVKVRRHNIARMMTLITEKQKETPSNGK